MSNRPIRGTLLQQNGTLMLGGSDFHLPERAGRYRSAQCICADLFRCRLDPPQTGALDAFGCIRLGGDVAHCVV